MNAEKLSKPQENQLLVRVWRTPNGLRGYVRVTNLKAAKTLALIFPSVRAQLTGYRYTDFGTLSCTHEKLQKGFTFPLDPENPAAFYTQDAMDALTIRLGDEIVRLLSNFRPHVSEIRYNVTEKPAFRVEG